jgi:hypothetical protein
MLRTQGCFFTYFIVILSSLFRLSIRESRSNSSSG